MIVCKNCEHENPEGATICEICYTSLSVSDTNDTIKCPNCGADAFGESTFCGQCGSKLKVTNTLNEELEANLPENLLEDEESTSDSPELAVSDSQGKQNIDESPLSSSTELEIATPVELSLEKEDKSNKTQLQLQKVSLFHIQTKTEMEIPLNLSVIHIGKVNGRIPPDIDVSGFPDSQIVSRVHADILQEANDFFIEDTGSANGTYINHIPLPTGNRHKLQNGDRIALGKEDKVSFIFQVTKR